METRRQVPTSNVAKPKSLLGAAKRNLFLTRNRWQIAMEVLGDPRFPANVRPETTTGPENQPVPSADKSPVEGVSRALTEDQGKPETSRETGRSAAVRRVRRTTGLYGAAIRFAEPAAEQGNRDQLCEAGGTIGAAGGR